MGILSWIIFGLIAGILAKWIMPGKDGGGFIVTVILGIIGAVVGSTMMTFQLSTASPTSRYGLRTAYFRPLIPVRNFTRPTMSGVVLFGLPRVTIVFI